MSDITGIHHVSALAGDPAGNAAFYTGVLGLRLVKKTVNFDDPTTYHLYFGDRVGRPGTLMTFFPHPQARDRTPGTGEVATTIFDVPPGSLGYWRDRLTRQGINVVESGERRIDFADPHTTSVALVESEDAREIEPAGDSDVPDAHAVRGIYAVSLAVPEIEPTAAFMRDVLGYRDAGGTQAMRWLEIGAGGAGERVELRAVAGERAQFGAGAVHHVAFRTADDESQMRLREAVSRTLSVTPVQDRNYFRSIYFREPGGVIFEIATDVPGFLVDEDEAALGTALKLPPQYEPHRAQIEARLPRL